MQNRLENGLAELGLPQDGEYTARLGAYIAELELWNRKLNLVSVADRDELVVRHILDSLAGAAHIAALGGRRIADIGSGAGLPGIPLAIYMPDREFVLVERSGKRAGFLRNAVAVAGLSSRVSIVEAGIEEVRDEFDVTILRAFRNFGDFYPHLKRITRKGGVVAAYNGRVESVIEDLHAAGLDLPGAEESETVSLKVPFLDEPRNLLVVRRS